MLGPRVLIQRCVEHKKHNVTETLPEALRASVRATLNQAYTMRDAAGARRMLENLARRLAHVVHPGAAASLREGPGETLTVMSLGLFSRKDCRNQLSSTNIIENLI